MKIYLIANAINTNASKLKITGPAAPLNKLRGVHTSTRTAALIHYLQQQVLLLEHLKTLTQHLNIIARVFCSKLGARLPAVTDFDRTGHRHTRYEQRRAVNVFLRVCGDESSAKRGSTHRGAHDFAISRVNLTHCKMV